METNWNDRLAKPTRNETYSRRFALVGFCVLATLLAVLTLALHQVDLLGTSEDVEGPDPRVPKHLTVPFPVNGTFIRVGMRLDEIIMIYGRPPDDERFLRSGAYVALYEVEDAPDIVYYYFKRGKTGQVTAINVMLGY